MTSLAPILWHVNQRHNEQQQQQLQLHADALRVAAASLAAQSL
jgi:hypothetical protein